MVSYAWEFDFYFKNDMEVLILVVVDNGLVPIRQVAMGAAAVQGLNPCCSGQWSRTLLDLVYNNYNNVS